MRITNQLQYFNFDVDYKRTSSLMNTLTSQISSGHKIKNSFDDSSIYIDTARLEAEKTSLSQIKESSQNGKTFADNSDSVLNEFSDGLIRFKTKLIQAANGTHDNTSLNAIANDLEAIKENLKDLANSSINGKFLFSGTAFSTKPIDNSGNYKGNDKSITATTGAKTHLPYNVDGKSMFLGSDSDYRKILSTNVKMYNKTIEKESGDKIYLKDSDTILDMIGDDSDDTTKNGKPVFYLSGRKPNGETFNNMFSIDTSSKVSDLLERIGESFGNSDNNQVVSVELNDYGQIEVTDLKRGNSILQMNIFGAIDREADGNEGNANVKNIKKYDNSGNLIDSADIDDLIGQKNVNIISFNKSDFKFVKAANKAGVSQVVDDNKKFNLNTLLQYEDGTFAEITDKLKNVLGKNVKYIHIEGNRTDSSSVHYDWEINNNNTVQDLMNEIKNKFGAVTVKLNYGQIQIKDTTSHNPSYFDFSMDIRDEDYEPVEGLSIPDSMNYSRRRFEKDGNDIVSNVSQIVRSSGQYATTSTKLIDVAGTSSLNNKIFKIKGNDINGNNLINAKISFGDETASPPVNAKFSYEEPAGTVNEFDIFNADGSKAMSSDLTYKQLSDVISMVLSKRVPQDGVPSGTTNSQIDPDEYNYAVKEARYVIETSLDYRGRLQIHDKTTSESKIEFSIYDAGVDDFSSTDGNTLSFMANDAIAIDKPDVDIFKDLDEMIQAVRDGKMQMDADGLNKRNLGIQNSIRRIEHIRDHVEKMHTKIGSLSNALDGSYQRSDMLHIHVTTLQSQIADTDIGEALAKYKQISINFQALLSTIAKTNSISLLNYL